MLVSWGDDGKGFAWKYIIPNTKKKNKCRGSFHLLLTLIALSLCHIDDKMSKTTKSTLMKELEKSSVLNNWCGYC